MHVAELDYELPDGLIAQKPPDRRDGGRLLIVQEPFEHASVDTLTERFAPGSLVIFNDTRVMRARLHGVREPSGAKVEVLLLNPLDPAQPDGEWQALLRCNRRLVAGDRVRVAEAILVVGQDAGDGTRRVSSDASLLDLSATSGHVPLPPYVKRVDDETDVERYQTVFSKDLGSAAAPTAGLHFTREAIAALQARGVLVDYVTLHVGAGTFRPVSTEKLDDHRMHVERYHVSPDLAARIRVTRERGRPVIAIGTTVVRALESAALGRPELATGWQATDLLIQPGFQFKVVDSLVTNFHAPKSTLLALVYAFGGTALVKKAYCEAISRKYRFLSYGDAMWIPERSK